ncbi:hypothetical protein BFW01_g1273 [Lasiodiplodia theobromae]|uniref:ChrR-like cupin domain-containing protein n=1 Tax=Lasiodiplodia theobromae TaxID=45133 RepID=A0A8H7MDM5_9PEZI|nr:hypothetical protein BFW01_g1273 [Lasiodiplodia theobromae]
MASTPPTPAPTSSTTATTTTTTSSSSSAAPSLRADQQPIPYRGPPLPNTLPDLLIPSALDLDGTDPRLWVPQAAGVWFRPLFLSASQGFFVNILRVRRSGVLSRHRHAGPVHALTLRGRWHYLEHEWWATPGSYAFETPGDIHTLEVPGEDGGEGGEEGVEMMTLFHVTGAYVYVDADGRPVGVEDVFSKIAAAKKHYEEVGLGEGFVEQFIR